MARETHDVSRAILNLSTTHNPPMNLSYHVLIDCTSGTFFGADTAYLLDTRSLTPEIMATLNDGSDSERCDLAESSGQDLEVLMDSVHLVRSIADALWGDDADTEWGPDTLDAIADAIRNVRPELAKS